jgi:DNA polymerase I-like protein with 3'-5' exonuclease and polymerase domains
MQQKSFNIDFQATPFTVHYIQEPSMAKIAIDHLMKKDVLFAIDIETMALPQFRTINKAGLSPHLSKVRLLQVFDGTNICVFDLNWFPEASLQMFVPFLSSKRFVAHYALFELQRFMQWGVVDMNIHCTLLLAKLMYHAVVPDDAGISVSLDSLAKELLSIDLPKACQVSDWGVEDLTYEQIEYAALDTVVCLKLAEKLVKGLDKYGLHRIYKLTKDAQHPIAVMQLNGFKLDVEAHRELIPQWIEDLVPAKRKVQKITGIQSLTAPKLGLWLEQNLDPATLAMWPRTDSGKMSTSADTFADFSYHEIVKPFLEYQKRATLCSTFGQTLINQVNPMTRRLHPTFKLLGARTGRLSSSEPNCFDADTEILTDTGWIKFPEITPASRVAQWDDGIITFTYPLNVIKQAYTGDLVVLKNQHIDMVCTAEHRCLLQNRRSKKYSVVKAIDYLLDAKQLHAGVYGDMPKLDTSFLTTAQIQLLVATQADAHFRDGGIEFRFRKKRKSDRLLRILKALNAKYTTGKRADKAYSYRIYKSDLVTWIRSILTDKKIFGKWVLDFSYEQLRIFCNELFYWDGLVVRRSNYASSIETNADWAQIALTLCGYRAKKRIYKYGPDKTSNSYQLDITHRDYSGTANVSKSIIPVKNQEVYCVEVPSSYIVIRRNGCTAITGNCQNMPRNNEIRNNFIAEEGCVFLCADYSQIELRIAAEISGDKQMLSAYREGTDLHALTASRVLNKAIKDVTKKERQIGKALGLGLLYGLGARKFSHYVKKGYARDGVSVSESEAFDYIERYRETYHGLRDWQINQAERCKTSLRATTPCGKIRKLNELNYYGGGLNVPIQGAAAEVMLYALVKLEKAFRGIGKLVNCVHDEVLIEVKPSSKDLDLLNCRLMMQDCMTEAYLEVFPKGITKNLVEASEGKTWATAK